MMKRKFTALCAVAILAAVRFASAQTPVTVTPDWNATRVQVPDDYAGVSYETLMELPDDQGKYLFTPDNKPLIAMFKELGIKNLRVGGNSADKPQVKVPSGQDIDNLFGFAKAADVSVIYTLRLREQTDPAADVEIAKYVMDHYGPQVMCLAVGNEPNIYDKQYDEYLKHEKMLMDAITVAEPNAVFCAPNTSHSVPKWAGQIANDLGPAGHLKFITQHNYVGGNSRSVKDQAAARAKLLQPEMIAAYQKFYDSFVPTTFQDKLKYRIEETNSFFNGGAAGASDTLASAIWGLDYLYWWAQAGASGMNLHTGDHVAAGPDQVPCRYALFWTSPTGYNVHPLGYAVKAFDLGCHGSLIPTKVDSKDNMNVTAYAVAAPDNNLLVTVINKENGDNARDAAITLAPGSGYTHGQVMFLTTADHNIAATTGVTLGGASINDDATWDGKWTDLPNPSADGQFTLSLPQASAAVVKLSK